MAGRSAKKIDKMPSAPVTPEQVREARRLLGYSRNRLARLSNVTHGFIFAFETSGRVARILWRPPGFDGLAAIRATLEAAGVEFTNGGEPDVKLRKQEP